MTIDFDVVRFESEDVVTASTEEVPNREVVVEEEGT